MFEPSSQPRVIGVPPGADFPETLYDSILERMASKPPEALARLQVLVATRRMQRRLIELFQNSGARLVPKIGVITDISHLIPGADLPAPVSSLRRILELKSLVARLVSLSDTLSASSVIDLADSLAKLLDEMQSEGVPLEALDTINTEVSSGHWEQSLTFLRAIQTYLASLNKGVADVEARHRAAAQMLCDLWASQPPETPLIVAGSTGSRDTTRMVMEAVSRLPQGAVVLPGFDFNLSDNLWSSLVDGTQIEDHPQYRFAKLISALKLRPSDVMRWGAEPDADRNKLISLALRPASVTDQWLAEGPRLGNLVEATKGFALMESSQPRDEALAIAVAIRNAVEEGKSAALIAPDATLSRRVGSVLRRWNIVPDDSAGMPLSLSPAGRFFRHVAGLIGRPVAPVELIALLKHPLTKTGPDRGHSQLMTQSFEVFLRRNGVVEVLPETLAAFAMDRSEDDQKWVKWLANTLHGLNVDEGTLASALNLHVSAAKSFCGDPDALFSGSDGESVLSVITKFELEADFAGEVRFFEYFQMFERALAAENVREQKGARPDVMIWGTLEARVQGADVIVLGGLNEGVWPEQPSPDPWLNRQMRRDIGLLLPERQIGLAAHDFQQAAGAASVIFSRAKRSEESETVPSRWLNRLLNLLDGLPDNHGPVALQDMRSRGAQFLASAAVLDQPRTDVPLAHRPAPSPPVDMRPSTLSVTDIEKLIRDPYAIYARRVLNLRPLDPLTPRPDARIKGTVFHRIFELAFAADAEFLDIGQMRTRLKQVAWDVLNKKVPWPATRVLWWGQLDAASDTLLHDEAERRSSTIQLGREIEGRYDLPGTRFRIVGKADRIDQNEDGLVIYDYKTGAPPTHKRILHFDRQILILALMAEAGAFHGIPAETVSKAVHLGVGRSPKAQSTDLGGDNKPASVYEHLVALLTRFDDPETGYISRRAMESLSYHYDYDHLARFGEWDASTSTEPEILT